ncbi:MAG: FAD-dependent monooxygenase [Rhodomicrobium sp.]
MTRTAVPTETDLFIVGGGPAGLAAAIATRKAGLHVIVADRAQPPIDKACGEGLMPDGVAALRQIGVELTAADGVPFRGIRFLDNECEAEASFPSAGCGFGIRRTRLHEILVDAAERAGAVLFWHSPVEGLEQGGVRVGGRMVRCGWIAGADGFHSRVRQWTGLQQSWSSARRIGLRQHFRTEPWTDFVEVYWNRNAQAYVTPVGPDEICIAMIGTVKEVHTEDLPALFPKLAARLAGAQPLGAPRGAITLSSRLSAVTKGRIALLGDASGTVDAVTGEGLHLAFRQASVLAEAIASGDVRGYGNAHRRMQRMPQFMASLLLLLDGNDRLRRAAFRTLAAAPSVFNALLAFHVGKRPPSALSLGMVEGAVRLLAWQRPLRKRA